MDVFAVAIHTSTCVSLVSRGGSVVDVVVSVDCTRDPNSHRMDPTAWIPNLRSGREELTAEGAEPRLHTRR